MKYEPLKADCFKPPKGRQPRIEPTDRYVGLQLLDCLIYSLIIASSLPTVGTWHPLAQKYCPVNSLRVVASKSHLSEETQSFIDDLAKNTENIEQISKGSSLKLVMVAEGEADIYPRLAPTMEWDTAEDAVVRESGKMTYQFESYLPVIYNKRDLLNPWFLVK